MYTKSKLYFYLGVKMSDEDDLFGDGSEASVHVEEEHREERISNPKPKLTFCPEW